MRRTLAIATVVALGLAGCSSGDEPEAAPSPSPSPRPELVTAIAEPVVRIADPAPAIGAPAAEVDSAPAEKAAAQVAEAVEAAAIAVIEETGTPTLPGDPTLTGPAVDLLAGLVRPKNPVVDVNVTSIVDAAPGGALVTVTLDARSVNGKPYVVEFTFTVSPEGQPFLALAEVTEGKVPKKKPKPAPTPSATEEAS